MSWRRNSFGLSDGWRFGAALHDFVGDIIGAVVGANAAGDAADTQAQAATSAAGLQSDAAVRAAEIQQQAAREALDFQRQIYGETTGNLAPYRDVGVNALGRLNHLLGVWSGDDPFTDFQELYGAAPDAQSFGSNFLASPGQEFLRKQGMEAITNSAAARGGRIGGNTLKALQGFGTGLASQDFWNQYNATNQNYWNRYNAFTGSRQNVLSNLYNVAGMGQNAAVQQGGFGAGAADVGGRALIAGGNAAAGGITGAADAGAAGLVGAGAANAAGIVGSGNAIGGGIRNAFADLQSNWLRGSEASWRNPDDGTMWRY